MTLDDIFSYAFYLLIFIGICKILEFLYNLFFSGYEERKQKEKIAKEIAIKKEEAYRKEQEEVENAKAWELEKIKYEYTPFGFFYLPSEPVERKWKKCEFCGEIVAYSAPYCPRCGAEVPKDNEYFTK
jgi:hypothetical protein